MKLQSMIPVAVIIMAMLIFTKCSKEDSSDSSELLNQEVSEAFQLKVGNDIKQFLTKVETHKNNPLLKSNETILVDSALWYLESGFNYCYGFPNEFYLSFTIDTLHFTLDIEGNQRVSMATLASKYEQMVDEIRLVYQASSFELKGLSLINLQQASTSTESISFTVNVVTGERTNNIPPQPVLSGPFDDDDYWYYGENKGRCVEFNLDSDAAQQLMITLNASLPDPSGNFYVINPVEVERKGGEPNVRRPNDPLDNQFDYYLFYASEALGTVDLCLERNTMNAYYNHLRYLTLNKIKDDEGLGSMYRLIGVTDMIGYYIDEDLPNIVARNYYHKGWFQYGIAVHYMAGTAPSEL